MGITVLQRKPMGKPMGTGRDSEASSQEPSWAASLAIDMYRVDGCLCMCVCDCMCIYIYIYPCVCV